MRYSVLITSVLALCVSSCADKYNEILQKDIDEKYTTPFRSIIPNENLEEFSEGRALKPSGKLPKWLVGTYIRTGPGKFKINSQKNEGASHFFDGFAFFTSFNFEANNKMTYYSSLAQTDQYKSSVAAGKNKLWGFAQAGEEEPEPHVSRDGQKVTTTNPAVNIVKIGDQYAGLGETHLPVTLDPETTKTTGFLDYDDTHIKTRKSWESAHPKVDPDTGVFYGMHIKYELFSKYVVYKINPGSTTRQIIKEISVSRPSYMHDMSITNRYIVLIGYPLTVSPFTLKEGKYGFIGAHKWEPNKKTKIYVIDKNSGELVKETETEAFFAWHHFNAYEDASGNINVLLRWNKDARTAILNPGDTYGLEKIIKKYDTEAYFARLEINVDSGVFTKHVLSRERFELATLPPHLTGKENRYLYALKFNYDQNKDAPQLKGVGVLKYDLKSNSYKEWNLKNGACSVPIFVPKPNGASEDDGVIITTVYDTQKNKSYLIVLDGVNLTEIARAETPQIIPQGLHGIFIPKK